MDPVTLLTGALIGAFSGALSLLWWVARLVYTGRLVPRTTLERAEAREAQAWDAYRLEVARNRELSGQVGTVVRAVERAVTP